MARKLHRWEYENFENNIDKCINCGILRHRTSTSDGISKKRGMWFMQYEINGVLVDKAPECKKVKSK